MAIRWISGTKQKGIGMVVKGEKTDEEMAAELDEFEQNLTGEAPKADPPEGDEPEPKDPTSEDEDASGDEKPEPELDDDAGEPQLAEGDDESDEPTDEALAVKDAPKYTVPDDKFYGDHRGKKLTAAQLEEVGLLDKVLTGAHQVANYQRRYEEGAEKLSELEERLKAVETPVEEEPQMSDEEFASAVRQNFDPVVQDLVKRGHLDKEYVADYPMKAAIDEYRVVVVTSALAELGRRINQIEGKTSNWSESEEEHKAINNVTKILGDLVTDDEQLCGGLKDAETQADFFSYLSDKERSGVRFTPLDATTKDIRGAWVQYLLDTGGDIPVLKKGGADPEKKGKKGMTGTGGKPRSTGGGQPKADSDDEFAAFEKVVEAAEAARFNE